MCIRDSEYSAPADSAVDPEIFWAGEFNGKQYKTAGQIYKEEADPCTLEKTAEECWLQADKIEEAIKLYVCLLYTSSRVGPGT